MRGKLIGKLQYCGYTVPIQVHPSAYVSSAAKIDIGTAIEPKAIMNVNSHISTGGIISVGVIVDHDVEIGDCCHVFLSAFHFPLRIPGVWSKYWKSGLKSAATL